MSGSFENPEPKNEKINVAPKNPGTAQLSREEAINSVREKNQNVKESILERQEIVEVKYENKKGKFFGQIVVDKELVGDVKRFFEFIEHINLEAKSEDEKFYIESVVPISSFGWSDKESMEKNNTSAFNYRHIKDDPTRPLSLHSFGFAIDINPQENPCFYGDGTKDPGNGFEKPLLTKEHKVVRYMVDELGFDWGGDWKDPRDNHHFEKILPTNDYCENYLNLVERDVGVLERGEVKDRVLNKISKLINNSFTKEHFDRILKLVNNEIIAPILGFAEVNRLRQSIKETRDEKLRS